MLMGSHYMPGTVLGAGKTQNVVSKEINSSTRWRVTREGHLAGRSENAFSDEVMFEWRSKKMRMN